MSPFTWEWWFHWTHDQVFIDILSTLLGALGPIAAGVITWFGNRWTGKLTKQTLENTKEATPPELLRLEKWSTILKDSENYPQKTKYGLDLYAMYSTYNDVLNRATLENRVINLGILSEKVIKDLVNIKPTTGNENYPQSTQDAYGSIKRGIFIVLLVLFYISVAASFFIIMIFNGMFQGWIVLIGGLIGLCFIVKAIMEVFREARESNIVFRNGYHALKGVYLARKSIELIESSKEKRERKGFEKSKIYKRWKNKIKNEHPEWESWNYGLDIGSDNNPEKANNSIEYYI